MMKARGKQHCHDSSLTARPSSPSSSSSSSQPQQQQQRHHRPKLKFCYVTKSAQISSPNSMAAERENVDVQPRNHEIENCDVNGSNDINNTVDETPDVAGSSSDEAKEKDGGDTEPDIDIFMSRLDKLLTDIQEPQLSQEHFTINDQLQQDELLVVESIYGENVFSLEKWKGLRCFQVHINIDVSDEIDITAKLSSVNELETVSSNSDNCLYSFKVQYLPPIVLTCLLPKSYPSHQPPIFTISVKWLESTKILSLCSMLDSIWAEQQGQEVIYHWVEWLHSSSLSYLGFDKEITIGPYDMSCVVDMRVVSGIRCIDADIPFLQSYNNERHHENFLKELHECCICYSEYPGTEFFQLPCKHFFCRKCLRTFTRIHVSEGTIGSLQCPDVKCRVMIPPGLLKHFLGDKDYERWESMMLKKTIASMSDVVYCPRCETLCIVEDEEKHALCPKCFFSFCTLCKDRRHAGKPCMPLDLKLLHILKDRQKSSKLKGNQKRREREMINEKLSMEEILRDSKLCPFCGMAISKIGGCNTMKCGNCDRYFCYVCNKAIDTTNPYKHFRYGTKSCELFPRDLVYNWEERMIWEERINRRQVVPPIQAEVLNMHGSTCPSCRQFNAKIGNNNHMFCLACHSHYCYLCNEIVRRGTKHYGPKRCKQHSEG